MPAFFEFVQVDPAGAQRSFVFKLENAQLIETARSLIAKKADAHVMGTIVKQPAPYNPEWQFHLDPPSVEFFEMAIEVCDANVTYVAEHLDEVGTHFLPNGTWCPWSSMLVREVTITIDPASGQLQP